MIFPFIINYSWDIDQHPLSDELLLQQINEALFKIHTDKTQQQGKSRLDFTNTFLTDKPKIGKHMMYHISHGHFQIVTENKRRLLKSRIYLLYPLFILLLASLSAMAEFSQGPEFFVFPVLFYLLIALISYLTIYKNYRMFISRLLGEISAGKK